MSVIERERVAPKVEPRTVTEADVLERAADLLEEFGWCQGAYALPSAEDDDMGNPLAAGQVSFCVAGAYARAMQDLGLSLSLAGDDTVGGKAEDLLRKHLTEYYLPTQQHYSVSTWNDMEGRTKHEVVAALREAAERARS